MEGIQFNTRQEAEFFNRLEAKYRGYTFTLYVWELYGNYLLIGDDLPRHTQEYKLINIELDDTKEQA